MLGIALGPIAMVASDQSIGHRPEDRAHFRPDIEGLRAVAVVAVLLFHMGVPGAAGEFIGVDVFYVISGFLITGLLVRELRTTSRIDFTSFYARRLRRLLPAALIVIVVTVIASGLVLSRLRFPEVAGDAAASALYVSNIRFALNATDYLASHEAPSPFLHFWSLAVEEQFYLLWPVFILLAARLVTVRFLALPLILVAIGSFILSLIWTDTAAPWAFFSLPTRAWELTVGALIAVGLLRLPQRAPPALAAALATIGLAIIVLSVVVIDPENPYPGTAALLPVVGTALVIVGGAASGVGASRWLSMRIPRWLGRISYSLYLWHWPLLVLVPIALRADGMALSVGLVAIAILLAHVSTDLIETPIRRERILRASPMRSLGIAGACCVAVAGAAVFAGLQVLSPGSTPVVIASEGVTAAAERTGEPESDPTVVESLYAAPSVPADRAAESQDPVSSLATEAGRTPRMTAAVDPFAGLDPLPPAVLSGSLPRDLTPSLEKARRDLPESYTDGCHLVDFLATEPKGGCVYGRRRAPTTVALIGDSHAAQWLPALQRLARERDWRLIPYTKSGCPMVEQKVWIGALKRQYRECDAWRGAVLDRLVEEGVDIAFVANSEVYQVVDADGRREPEDQAALWRAGMLAGLRAVDSAAGQVVVIADTPRVPYEPLECLASRALIEECDASSDIMLHPDYAAVEAAVAQEAGVPRISANEWICPDGRCPLVRGDILVFRDDHHITATFARMLAKRLGVALDAAVARP